MQANLRDLARQSVQDERGAFLDILEVDPKNAQAFDYLGSTLLPGESLQLPDGLQVAKKALHLKALELDAFHSAAHSNLAVSLSPGEVVQVQGHDTTQRALFQRAVELDAKNAMAHSNLGVVLEDHEVLRMKDGQVWDKQSLYMKAIELDPGYAFAYNNLAVLNPQEWIRLADGSIWNRRKLYLKALELDPNYAVAYNNLALSLNHGEKVSCFGNFWDRKALHLKALELDHRHCCAYRDLASALHPMESVLFAGQSAGKRELLMEAVRLEPSAEHLRLLAEQMQSDEELMLHGNLATKMQLLVRALKLDPEPITCAQLGLHLGRASCHVEGWPSPSSWFGEGGEGDDGTWSGWQLMQRALHLAPSCPDVLMAAAAFELATPEADRTKARRFLLTAIASGRPNSGAAAGQLALLIPPRDVVRLPSQEVHRGDLLIAACEEVDDAQFLAELACELDPGEVIGLRGKSFDVCGLCREVLTLDPHHSMAQELLRNTTTMTLPKPLLLRWAVPELIQSYDDWQEPEFQPSTAPHELDRFVLALAAMEVEGGSCQGNTLAEFMGPMERVRLSPGRSGTSSKYWEYRSRSQLHRAALDLDPSSSRTWTNLGVTTEQIEFQGRHYNREAMFEKALELNPENATAAANLAALRRREWRKPRSGWKAGEVKHLVESSHAVQEKACKLQPRGAQRRLRLARALAAENGVLETQQLHGLCLSHLQEAFRLDGDDADVCHQLGLMLWQTETTLKTYEGSWTAETLLSRALMLKPQAGGGAIWAGYFKKDFQSKSKENQFAIILEAASNIKTCQLRILMVSDKGARF
eukprot:symbB.v1.2.002533.t1/scaffold127.1/size312441/5